MIRVNAGPTTRYCDGVSRRSFLQLGVAGMASLGLGDVLRARAASADRRDTAVILVWLDGGPSHMDLYDMKPEAPAEYRGIWKPIKTNVPGIDISPLFPRQAKCAHRFSLVRSLHHDSGDHFTGAHTLLTGRAGRVGGARTEGENPGLGAVVAKVRGPNRPGLPAYVAVPSAHSIGIAPGYHGGNYLGNAYNPFDVGQDPSTPDFHVPNLRLVGNLSFSQLSERKSLIGQFDQIRRDVDRQGTLDVMDRFQRDAYQLVAGPEARRAFDLSAEDPKLRDTYGHNTLGQSLLLARRLVESGVTFVTADFGGWDHHWDLEAGLNNYLPKVDAALSSLLNDLADRGLLERTLVVMCGEFGRTPKMNDGGNGGAPRSMGTPGRDHWGNSMFCFLAGGGLRGGQVVGSTDQRGTSPKDRPLHPADIHATIYRAMGIDPTIQFLDRTGRPVSAIDQGNAIHELF